ncbi:MAG: sensor histidine kinase [Streptosporangiaceae bacterium]
MTTETPGSGTLEALRAARASRETFRRRMLPFLVVILGGVAYFSARQSPHLGLHGKSLALSVGLAGFVVGALGVRQTLLRQPRSARAWGPFAALLLLSSGLLLWAQPAGPGAGGFIVAISAAMIARVISSRLGVALIVITIVATAIVITETATGQQRHQGFTGFLGAVLSFVGIFLYAMVVWRFRQNDEQSTRLLAQMEETRDAELRAAALSERQRLAREMHDVLAHSLSGLVVQLEGARLLALSDPADGRLATTIDRAHQLAKSGLDEARRAIGMLRDDDLPGPDKLAALARAYEVDTGIPCRYAETGQPAELRPAVKLALYRVTQEGLTNIRKHARPERVEVRLEYLRDGVSLAVEDFTGSPDTPAPAAAIETSGGGYGLTGMRERAELLGGTLTAAATGCGFRVMLRVPA